MEWLKREVTNCWYQILFFYCGNISSEVELVIVQKNNSYAENIEWRATVAIVRDSWNEEPPTFFLQLHLIIIVEKVLISQVS